MLMQKEVCIKGERRGVMALQNMFSKGEKVINKVVSLPIDSVYPNPAQPRKSFSIADLNSLAESIRSNGILQPLTVRRAGDKYELIAGERRLKAAKLVGLETIPCIIVDASDQESAVYAVLENLQRANLTFFEEARAYHSLIHDWHITQEQAAAKLGKAQPTIANKLRLLRLSSDEEELILENGLTERHARALLRIEDADTRIKVIENIVTRNLNVNQTEELIEQLLTKRKKSKKKLPTILIKDIRIFFNTMDRAIDLMKNAGVDVKGTKIDHDDHIEYVVLIAKDEEKKAEIS